MCGREMQPALDADENAHDNEDGAGKIGQLPGNRAESAEAFFRMAQTPCRERTGRNERDGQPDTESKHHGDAEREPFQLKANEDDGESGGTGQQSAGKSENSNLPVGYGLAGKPALDVGGMGNFVCILVAKHLGGGIFVDMFMRMVVVVGMPMMVPVVGLELDVAPGAPCHPERQRYDDDGGTQLEIRLRAFGVPLASKMKRECGQEPDDETVRKSGAKSQEHRLPNGTPNGDDKGGHEGLGVARFQPMQGAQEQCTGDEKPGVERALLDELIEIFHSKSLLGR
jgi:hypothetical protein